MRESLPGMVRLQRTLEEVGAAAIHGRVRTVAQNGGGRWDRLRKLLDGSGSSSALEYDTGGDISSMRARYDSWPSLVSNMARRDMLHRLVIGTNGKGDLLITEPRRNVLILGPPRKDKTTGVLIPTILSHPGPVVTASIKDDVLRATGLARARLGRVWHYGPDGSPTPRGCSELRWSPIAASKSWVSAVGLGESMANVAEVGGNGENASFFREKAGILIAPLLYAAALGDKPMLWVLKAVAHNRDAIAEAKDVLALAESDDAQLALNDLQGILDLDPKSQSPIFATTANAFSAYRLPGALATTQSPNFDPASFVAGQPSAYNPYRDELVAGPDGPRSIDEASLGIYDTIYVTASSSQQRRVAPLVVGLLQQIREARFDLHRADETSDYFGRPSVLWALDELAGMAPIRDLPETLTQAGGQGLVVAACLQDLNMARLRWDRAAEGFLTLFGHVVVLAGIRDKPTLEAISTVIGKHWVPVRTTGTSSSTGPGSNQSGWNESTAEHLVPILDPGEISECRSTEDSHFVLHLKPTGKVHEWAFCTPYYLRPPWPQLLVGTMEFAAARAEPLERAWALAPPILDMDGDGWYLTTAGEPYGAWLLARYRNAASSLRHLAQRRAEFMEHRSEPGSLLAGFNDTRSARQRVPSRLFIALRRDPGPAALTAAMVRHSEIRPGTGADATVIRMTMYDAINTPLDDVPEARTPDWVVSYEGHKAHLNIVDGGVATKLATGNSTVERWQDEIPGTAVLIEAWYWSRAAGHMVLRLSRELQELTPACVLSDDWFFHYGAWSATDAEAIPAIAR